MSDLDYVRQSLDMNRVVEYYGLRANKKGFLKCPFHSEKTGSLRIYENGRGWHCYGCGVGGSVIDFVMKYFNINFSQAIMRLNHDFSLGVTQKKPSARDFAYRKEKIEAERKQKHKERQHDYKFNQTYIKYHNLRKQEPSDEFYETLEELIRMEDEYFGT